MKQTITLQLAKLRKRNGITQRQLAEELETSFQNVSKWETGATMPDITLLPVLAAYFQVSVDELLGLVPLKDETYIPKGTGSEAFWDQKLEYLKRTRKNAWNPDYLEFLVRTVWRLDKPVSVLDCGCGYGYLGALLLPLLPGGSTYTGVDFSKNLLDYGEKLFAEEGLLGRFLCEDFLEQNAQWYKDRNETERLISHGMSKSEAENYSGRGRRVREYFEQHPSEVSYLLFRGKTITFGWKEI